MTQTNKLRQEIVDTELRVAHLCGILDGHVHLTPLGASQIIKACKKAGLRFVDMPEGFTDEGIEEIEI